MKFLNTRTGNILNVSNKNTAALMSAQPDTYRPVKDKEKPAAKTETDKTDSK